MGLQAALEREVVGQRRAVQTLARTLTTALGGLTDATRPLGTYLLMGPSGTGKSHFARTVSRLLHPDGRPPVVVDCHQISASDPWHSLGTQIGPYLAYGNNTDDAHSRLPARSVLLIDHLEAAPSAWVQAFVSVLESGSVMLPDGKRGSFEGSLVLMTSDLCTREIQGEDRKEIGFSPATGDLEEREKARIYQTCSVAAEKRWGTGLLGHIDDLIVFHCLREIHLFRVVRLLLSELNLQLAERNVVVDLTAGAEALLVERCRGFSEHGAWFLVKVFRRFVTFPVADAIGHHVLTSGGRISVERSGERLRFDVSCATATCGASSREAPAAVTVDWSDRPPSRRPSTPTDPGSFDGEAVVK